MDGAAMAGTGVGIIIGKATAGAAEMAGKAGHAAAEAIARADVVPDPAFTGAVADRGSSIAAEEAAIVSLTAAAVAGAVSSMAVVAVALRAAAVEVVLRSGLRLRSADSSFLPAGKKMVRRDCRTIYIPVTPPNRPSARRR
jgi:hypothetical protein